MSLHQLLDQLAAFTPTTLPVLSLYLNAQADQHGRDSFAAFVRKELPARAKTYPLRSLARASIDRDTERIQQYLQEKASCKFFGDDLQLRGNLLGEPQLCPLLVEFHHF
jgi:hypothetical protein